MSSRDPLTRGEKQRITRLRAKVLDWYSKNGRDFPWRHPNASTYERICVEVLLQRTRAETVAGIYRQFFDKFPSWVDIAKASTAELESQFKPIGLWKRRAQSIKKLALYVAPRQGIFPSTPEELVEVPAVGQYVANAILMFQHGQARPLLDTNMARVIERYIRPRKLADIRYDPWLQSAAYWLTSGDRPIVTNWAVLDFASTICAPRSPRCQQCVLASACSFRKK